VRVRVHVRAPQTGMHHQQPLQCCVSWVPGSPACLPSSCLRVNTLRHLRCVSTHYVACQHTTLRVNTLRHLRCATSLPQPSPACLHEGRAGRDAGPAAAEHRLLPRGVPGLCGCLDHRPHPALHTGGRAPLADCRVAWAAVGCA